MKAIVLAYHNIGCIGIKALLRNGFDIIAVFTHRDDPGENIWFDSVAELAASLKIPVFAPEDINHPLWVRRISEMGPEILFSFYYRHMLRQSILGITPGGVPQSPRLLASKIPGTMPDQLGACKR